MATTYQDMVREALAGRRDQEAATAIRDARHIDYAFQTRDEDALIELDDDPRDVIRAAADAAFRDLKAWEARR